MSPEQAMSATLRDELRRYQTAAERLRASEGYDRDAAKIEAMPDESMHVWAPLYRTHAASLRRAALDLAAKEEDRKATAPGFSRYRRR